MFASSDLRALAGILLALTLGGPCAADQTVYDNALQNGWGNWSWDTTVNTASASTVHSAGFSISAQYTGAWGGLQLGNGTPVPAAGIEKIRFWLHGGAAGGQQIKFTAEDAAAGANPAYVSVVATTAWTLHEVPLTSLGSLSDLQMLVWQDLSGGPQPVFYVDDIELVTDDVPVTFSVDPSQNRRAISPDIYGMSYCGEALAAELRLPVNRWGGNSTTRYNWQVDVSNRAADWYFQNIVEPHPNPAQLPDGSSSDRFVEQNRRTGTRSVITVPMIGWTPKPARTKSWSYSIAKYGAQTGSDWEWEPDSGNGVASGSNARITTNDPLDTCVAVGTQYVKNWIAHLQGRYGTAPTSGSVQLYSLDNEPMLWHDTHRDVRKTPLGYDELRTLTYDYAAAVKQQDAGAQTLGPGFWGWTAYFWSNIDEAGGPNWWNNPPDRNAHGGTALSAWYLQQMKAYEDTTGTRILDYFDLHCYPQAAGVFSTNLGNASVQAARLQATRSLWDPTYVDGSWIDQPVNLIPRMKAWIAENYPGTKTCVSEYSFGALGYLNGALAQADALGVFGREGLDMAMLWTAPAASQPAAFSFRMFRNYDGAGRGFGETSIRAVSPNPAQYSLYAAERAYDGALTVMAVNKTGADLTTSVGLSGFSAGAAAEVWRYSAANLNSIVRQPDAAVDAGAVAGITLPAQSITLLVVPSSTPTPVAISGWGIE